MGLCVLVMGLDPAWLFDDSTNPQHPPDTHTQLSAPHLVFVTRPNTGRSHIEMDLGEVMGAYEKCDDPAEAESYWTVLYDETEDHCVHGPNCKVAS